MELFVYDQLKKKEKEDWWFVGRRKIITALLERYRLKKRNLSIIDIGCGAGDVLEVLAKYGDPIGLDSNRNIVAFNKKNGKNVVFGKAEKIPFPKENFDLVCLLEVLEHLDNDQDVLREVNRVLKKHGQLLITSPAFSFLWSQHDVAAHHKRRYSKKELEKKLKAAGFKIVRISYMNTILFLPIYGVRLFKNVFNISQGKTDFYEYPSILNKILGWIFGLESIYLQRFDTPFGVSVLVLAEKK